MLKFIKYGNIVESETEAIVNTVNTVGVMGKGIALQFKKAFPDNYKAYLQAAKEGKLKTGKIFVTETGRFSNPRYIVNFPTKEHWKYPSKLQWIKDGLADLRAFLINNRITSVSIPPLGCGNGKLNWADVKPLIVNSTNDIPGLDVYIYEPSDFVYTKPKHGDSAKKPKLTSARAMVLSLFNQYLILGYELTLIEAQKLVYFLQRFGENLKLEFSKGKYGPYADKLVHVLYDMDGFYLQGMKEKTAAPMDILQINRSEIPNIESYINNNCSGEQKQRLSKVYDIIEGFESPLGMELLATTDYVIHCELNNDYESPEINNAVYNWSHRKKKLMKKEFIALARKRLSSEANILYK